jgi:hypothetical protein
LVNSLESRPLSFIVSSRALKSTILIPRYYDPTLDAERDRLSSTHELVSIRELCESGSLTVSPGDEIGKMVYGTGRIPFVRTSDIANWEIKADAKQGVSDAVYERYAAKQDLQVNDLLFVRDGTYLIGTACLITPTDSRSLYQSHLLKLRATTDAAMDAPLLLGLLSTPFVQAQIRSKQFTADIIDTLGDRYKELILPVPRSAYLRGTLSAEIKRVVYERSELRQRLGRIPLLAEGHISDVREEPPEISLASRAICFVQKATGLAGNVLIPKYYDPAIDRDLSELAPSHELVSIGELIDQSVVSLTTGVEVGKMAYGTGDIPFIRTSDIVNWELKTNPKQSISDAIYEEYAARLDVRAEDILLVRDGTYLVGTSCILNEIDSRMLFAGGLYKIRVVRRAELDPFLFLALLNSPIVKRQMRSKQFTRDIIDTLGWRIREVVLPIPKDKRLRSRVAEEMWLAINARVDLREQIRVLPERIQSTDVPTDHKSVLDLEATLSSPR